MVNILDYIDKMQVMYGDKDPSSTVPEPRNMYAQGQLVQPNADGSRPGYNGKKKLDPANLKRQQDGLQNYYDKFGKETLDKLSKKRHGKVFNKLSTDDLSNFKRRIIKFEDFITENNRMPTEKEARSIGRQPRIKTEQAIQIKLLEETNTGKFFDPEKFAKENNISMKELKREAGLLQNNIYNKRMKMSGKEMRRVLDWIPDDVSVSDNALNKLWKSKLIKYERNKIEELFYDAFGREFVKGTKDKNPNFNPKKHLAIRNNLTEYYKLREAINLKYPNINLALDHPLSKSTLKKVFNATPDQLTRVNPLEADLNNGFKDSLSLQYEKAIQGKDTPKKKAVEKIARDLKLNIGKVSDDATNFKYGVKEFQKLNMKDEVLKAVQNQADLSSNFKNYVKQNPDLFKAAGVNPNTNITKITQRQVKQIESLLGKDLLKLAGTVNSKCRKAAVEGGRMGFQDGLSPEFCINEGKKVARDLVAKNIKGSPAQNSIMKRVTSGLTNFVKSALDPKELFNLKKQFLSKGAIASLPFFDAGIAAYEATAMGKPVKEAISDTFVFGSLPRAMGVGMDTSDVLNAKQLLKDPQLSPAGKEYAQLIIDSGDYEKMQSDTTGGMTKKFTEFKEMQDKIKNASTAGRFDYESRLNEVEGAELAKDDYSPIFGNLGDPLKNRAVNTGPKTRGGRGAVKDYKIDLSPVTYENFKPNYGFTKEQFEDAMRKEGALADDEVYQDAFYKQEVEKPIEFQQLMELPSFRGASENFAGGGIAGLSGGDPSGAMLESMNPDSQGLRSLYKNGRKL